MDGTLVSRGRRAGAAGHEADSLERFSRPFGGDAPPLRRAMHAHPPRPLDAEARVAALPGTAPLPRGRPRASVRIDADVIDEHGGGEPGRAVERARPVATDRQV